jgi:RND family efflux transporter MFP subunit
MWIIRAALRYPLTFFVMAILIVLSGLFSISRAPVDILPDIKLPVISVVWNYAGLPPADMSNRVITYFERQMTTAVSDIDHVESQSLPGVGVVKVFFHENVNISVAQSQVTAIAQNVLKGLPPGITPPQILSYNASSVPIMQLALTSQVLTDQQLFDLSNNFIRPQLAEVEGAAVPSPYGGKARLVSIDLDSSALHERGLSGQDVATAVGAENLTLPAGTQKVGNFEYNVLLNSSPLSLADMENLPLKTQGGTVVYLRDVAHVRDGYAPQTNIVRVNGRHSVLTTIQKNGSVSTLKIISEIKSLLPRIRAGAPSSLNIRPINDQSIFVSAAVMSVAREGVMAAALTGLMILLFLGSLRSTLIITISIPLAVLASISLLSVVGETINVMTLGGLALAVGILVDDATVTIENVNWHLEQGKDIEQAILEGGQQIILPALFSLLCISIVFVPMFYLEGVAKYLFVPMAEAVVFALTASFCLSRTLIPALAKTLLKQHRVGEHAGNILHSGESPTSRSGSIIVRFQKGFERAVTRARHAYHRFLELAIHGRRWFIPGFMVVIAASLLLLPWLGKNFFPSVDSGQMKLHIRAQTGTRIEETARLCDQIEKTINQLIPGDQLGDVIDNIGLPVSGINITYSNSAPIGSGDADILIDLKNGHEPTEALQKRLREELPRRFPGTTFAFLPADIVSQILNFGLPAPIDVQVIGFKRDQNHHYAEELLRRLRHVPGIADLRLQQAFNQPQIQVNVDRTRAHQVGLTQRNVADSLLVSLSGSGQVAPNFWVNPENFVSYPIVVQSPQYHLESLGDLGNLALTGPAASSPQILANLASLTLSQGEGVVSHYDVQPTMDLFASVQGRDLGAVAADIRAIIKETSADVPLGTTVELRGQVQTMDSSYWGLELGILASVLLIYLLLVIMFQSWTDPFIVITALPAAIAGIAWMLFLTGTTLSVPALTGAMMCMGVATANSILVVSFARERLALGHSAALAAAQAGATRFRPVLMTALAMMIGMLPMALGLGEGGEQNAPLGRAVIGGLIFATAATLMFVPVVFSLLHRRENSIDPSTEQSKRMDQEPVMIETMSPAEASALSHVVRRFGWVALIVATALAVLGIGLRLHGKSQVKKWTETQAISTVTLATLQAGATNREIVLPGTLRANVEAPIYARVNGYLKNWNVDIGAHVHSGQVMAEIETPELDQQIRQAQSDLETATAHEQLAQITALRWSNMLASDSVSRQEADEKAGDAVALKAARNAAAANLQRLKEIAGFKRIVAPFDGVVTVRNTDVGALINAGAGTGQELFRIADMHVARVYIDVPQTDTASIHVGQRATLRVPEQAGLQVEARVAATSRSIRENSRTMQVELMADNANERLLPGQYVEVHVPVAAASGQLTIPTTALLFRKQGLQLATLGADSRVKLKAVTLAHEDGGTVTISSGIDTTDRVIDSPPDSLADGEQVRLASTPTAKQESPQAATNAGSTP